MTRPRQAQSVNLTASSLTAQPHPPAPQAFEVCPRCASVLSTDVRQVMAPAEEMVDLLDASWRRSFTEDQVEFFRASLRVVWARAYRAGRTAA